MASMPIIVVLDIGIEELVELPIGIPDIVLVGELDIDIDIEPIELAIDISIVE